MPGTISFNKFISKKMLATEEKDFHFRTNIARMNADFAYKKLFSVPHRGQNTEIVVTHGNAIRYWVCKALDIPEERWIKMDVSHASLTTIRIFKSGKLVLLGFADMGHLPLKIRTYI